MQPSTASSAHMTVNPPKGLGPPFYATPVFRQGDEGHPSRAGSPEEARALSKRRRDRVGNDCPWIWLTWRNFSLLTESNLKGMVVTRSRVHGRPPDGELSPAISAPLDHQSDPTCRLAISREPIDQQRMFLAGIVADARTNRSAGHVFVSTPRGGWPSPAGRPGEHGWQPRAPRSSVRPNAQRRGDLVLFVA